MNKKPNSYYVQGVVYEIIYADTPEEAKREFINLKGAYEHTVVIIDDEGREEDEKDNT